MWTLPGIFAASIAPFIVAWGALGTYPGFVFYMLPARAWELGAGVALAVVEIRKDRRRLPTPYAQILSTAGFVLMIMPMALLRAGSPFPGAAALPTVVGTTLIIATPASWVNRYLLSGRPLVYIGKISYAWYLWHWPLLAYLRIVFGDTLPAKIAVFAVLTSLAMAVLSYFAIEQPFRRSKSAPAPLLVRYCTFSFFILAICMAIWLGRGLPARYPSLARIEYAIPWSLTIRVLLFSGSTRRTCPRAATTQQDRGPL